MPSDFAPHNLTEAVNAVCQVADDGHYGSFEGWGIFKSTPADFLGSGGAPWIVTIVFHGVGYKLHDYTIKNNSAGENARAPKDWTMQGSDDGITWTTLDTVTGQTGWSSGETRNFVCDTITTAYNYFRLNLTACDGDATYCRYTQLFLYGDVDSVNVEIGAHDMTNNSSHSPLVASASSHFGTNDAFQVFDNNKDVPWIGTNTGVDWLKLDTGGLFVASGYRVLGSASFATRNPKAWTFEGSNDNSSWTTLDTQSSQTWSLSQIRFYPITPSVAYRYFRLNITQNNGSGGDAAYTEVAELYIVGAAGAAGGSVQPIMMVIC